MRTFAPDTILVASRIPTLSDQRAFVLWVPDGFGYHLDVNYQTQLYLTGGHIGWPWSKSEAWEWVTDNAYWTKRWVPLDTDLLMDEGL